MKGESLTLISNGYIVISFHCKDKRLRFPTGQKNGDNSTNALRKIESVKKAVDDYIFQCNNRSIDIIHDELKVYLDNRFRPNKKAPKAERDFIEDHKTMIEKMRNGEILTKKRTKYSAASIKQFRNMRAVWKKCADSSESGFVLTYDMTIAHVDKLIIWMIGQNYMLNSIHCAITLLQIFLSYSFKEGYHNNQVYKHDVFKVPTEESDNIAPSFAEILKIYNYPLNGTEEKIRDFFVYGCFLALRVGDLSRINDYIPNGSFMEVYTSKGSKKVTIPLHWIAKEIYEKYNGNIPVVTPYYLSTYIPIIARRAEVTGTKLITYTEGGIKKEELCERYKLFSPHSMRRFFATWMYKDLRRQPREIMLITGHSSESSFYKYIKIEAEENALEILKDPAFCRKD
ncbi:tyrosine-type recombinase/integrase [Chitinophaga sp. Hz27]|uniref:tyrosine-type recombinase/integrase n=1 Tax=Chitinophaga sp. Hz27 TaxID=3347169 RepID=UPI0035D782B6